MKNLDQITKIERQFLELIECDKNDNDVYLYISQNGNTRISLDFILNDYKSWLILNDYVKEIKHG